MRLVERRAFARGGGVNLPNGLSVFRTGAANLEHLISSVSVRGRLTFGTGLAGLLVPVARLSPAADRVQPALRPYQQAFTNQRRRRQSHLAQLVHVLKPELLARRDHERLPLLAQAEEPA